MTEVVLPELGEGIRSAIVSCLYKKVGQSVSEGDDIVELTTDKATFNVSATTSGRLEMIKVQEGDEAAVGQILAVIT